MWLFEERETAGRPKKPGLLLTAGVEHVVGRKDCSVLIQDDASISRKHSIITLNHDESSLGDPSKISQVLIHDFSKYGTFVNGTRISGSSSLKSGDEILFGKNNSYYKLRCCPLVVVASCLEEKKKKTLKTLIHKLGGHITGDWQPNITSHLVMDGLTFTIKVIHALAECCPIVTPLYFEDVANSANPSSVLDRVHSYLPPLKEYTISSQGERFRPSQARKSLLKGKTFIFISKKQFKRVHHAVESSGGVALLKDTPGSESDGGLVSKDVCVMMMDNKEKNSLSAESLQWVLHITETLTRHRCRLIPESELGLALLFLTLENYCNPSIAAVPALTQPLVSQSFQAADVMSQHIVDHEKQALFKKPWHPVKAKEEDRAQEITGQKQTLASCTTDQKYATTTTTTLLSKRSMNEKYCFESVPDSQTDSQGKAPLTKRRKLLKEESPTLVSESLHENKTLNGSHSNIELELADHIVADSLQIGQGDGIETAEQPTQQKDISHSMISKVEKIPDSQNISTDSHMSDDKEETTVEHSKVSTRESLVKSVCRQTEDARRNEGNELIQEEEKKEEKKVSNFHVPVGFLCSRIPRKMSLKTEFEDDADHLPRNLVVVDHVCLVVQPSVALSTAKYSQETITAIKNTKKFKKQFYPGSRTSLPRIIGGSDLAIYQSSERLNKDDWFMEARQADAERQREERMAEELFRWEERPVKSRRTNR
ncbi:nibrin-like isoform X2 [Montipora foliosa]|uniref:nibrin-like isoform X2 n=1 Tax=Montipora foliosa TaxID=591990 RepID=UPI0035F1BA98